jgi:hypothetical protein
MKGPSTYPRASMAEGQTEENLSVKKHSWDVLKPLKKVFSVLYATFSNTKVIDHNIS